jgi:hypothetical protein
MQFMTLINRLCLTVVGLFLVIPFVAFGALFGFALGVKSCATFLYMAWTEP